MTKLRRRLRTLAQSATDADIETLTTPAGAKWWPAEQEADSMAKAKTTAKAAGADKKKPAKAKAKSAPKKAARKTKAAAKGKSANKGYVALAKLAEHPLVIDLIAIGATAAVAALAGRAHDGKSKGAKSKSSTGAVKAAGQAAAAAVGKRLMTEYEAVKDVAAAKKKKAKAPASK